MKEQYDLIHTAEDGAAVLVFSGSDLASVGVGAGEDMVETPVNLNK